MILSRYTIKHLSSTDVEIPSDEIFSLPEKVLQFGTGVLLRGLPDYFIDKANRRNIFNGRIVMVKSTRQGDTSAFDKQDCLYTTCVRGIEDGEVVEKNIINSSISRVLSAQEHWEQILECAYDSNMQVIISNTTEVGIALVDDDIRRHPPVSFPGKLLAFLYERFKAFNGSASSGMVIVPTELIPDNGKLLESIVLELAHLNGLEGQFIEWLEQSNHFCSSLVDRIVPGKPAPAMQASLENKLGYSDELLIMTEAYTLWAIAGDAHVRDILSFAQADSGVIIEENIDQYRELKLRLLNATHTLSSGVAVLNGCATVKDAMDDEAMVHFIKILMHEEIAPAIPYEIAPELKSSFGNKVLDRFRNPNIEHHWMSITVQYSSKMRMRCLPLLLSHYRQTSEVPMSFALGFAAFLRFMKAVTNTGTEYQGEINGKQYTIKDDQAKYFFEMWKKFSGVSLVNEVLGDIDVWNEDLTQLPGFADAVAEQLQVLEADKIQDAIKFAVVQKVLPA